MTNPMRESPHRLKLAVFGVNVSGGCAMTSVPGTIEVTWQESKRIAIAAERAGIDALVPVARWRGMGGATNFNHRSFDPFTWAAGLAAVTERIALFATCHVPTVHPVRVAKEFATVDHISGGRFCLNIVAGWNQTEIAMFGTEQLDHDARYDMAEDWLGLIRALWRAQETFHYQGAYFDCPNAYSEPSPVQVEPVIMSAGNSPRGIEFAAANADLNFVVAPDLAGAGEAAQRAKAAAASHNRALSVYGQVYIVCCDTEAEAVAMRDRYVHEHGDWEGVRNLLDVLIPNSQSALGEEWESMAANMIAGYGALPLVGTADQVVEGLIALSEAGLDGTTMSWVDYHAGIEQYERVLKPRLEEAGLREKL